MRSAAAQAWIQLAQIESSFIFLTGDLGFQALEELRKQASNRFINAGVAEQNMVSVAAGLACQGFKPWVYSIAPFTYARPFEQIRNDLCHHHLPVKLIGNGGGYGYGVMGPTHHALEDCSVLCSLPGMKIFVPAFDEDLWPVVKKMNQLPGPSYLRLGLDEKPHGYTPPTYQSWRKLLDGNSGILVVLGPLVTHYLSKLLTLPSKKRPELWVVSELSSCGLTPPSDLLESIRRTPILFIAEEHVAQGGMGQQLIYSLTKNSILPQSFEHFFAKGYPSGRHGSQNFYRKESELDVDSLLRRIERAPFRKD